MKILQDENVFVHNNGKSMRLTIWHMEERVVGMLSD